MNQPNSAELFRFARTTMSVTMKATHQQRSKHTTRTPPRDEQENNKRLLTVLQDHAGRFRVL